MVEIPLANIPKAMFMWFLVELLYTATMTCLRLSIALFLCRIIVSRTREIPVPHGFCGISFKAKPFPHQRSPSTNIVFQIFLLFGRLWVWRHSTVSPTSYSWSSSAGRYVSRIHWFESRVLTPQTGQLLLDPIRREVWQMRVARSCWKYDLCARYTLHSCRLDLGNSSCFLSLEASNES